MRKNMMIYLGIFLILLLGSTLSLEADDDLDFGDAPDPTYPTLGANNGAAHIIGPIYMGSVIDPEPDGQPDPSATGDDNDGSNDDDGVVFTSTLLPGQLATVIVTVSAACQLDAWIDFDANGIWLDPGEQIFVNISLAPGANPLSFNVPPTAVLGSTFARFRVSSAGGLMPDGLAPDGEVEDYMVRIGEETYYDWGDAPDTAQTPGYPTLSANNGAYHLISGSVYLGAGVDAESNGQPDTTATGDDNDGNDDEDGVNFTSGLIPGQVTTLTVTAASAGKLDAWVDFNINGSWGDTGEQIFASQTLISGTNNLSFTVPAQATTGTSFARFRFSTAGGLSPTGQASDGEVEDYQVSIGEESLFDWGDAPDSVSTPGYPTFSANSGASHVITTLFLGGSIDAENDGQPDSTATGDDNDGNDDEDGVSFTTSLVPGQNANVTVNASGAGKLDAWIDFNRDGDWSDAGEKIFGSTPVASGTNNLNFSVPVGASSGASFARFRFSTAGGLSPTGQASDGEVEDYQVTIAEEQSLDYGDAPDAAASPAFPTLLVHDGARHVIDGVTYLGGAPDAEPDGQPDGTATGDDLAGTDDEDGVIFTNPLVPGFTTTIDVIASVPGYLDAWMDFDGNGVWSGTQEQVAVSFPLNPGPNQVPIMVPANAAAGGMMCRFRFSSTGGLAPTGLANDGEVEDYEVDLADAIYDWGDAPDPNYPTLSANSGAVHQLVENLFLGSTADGESDGQQDPKARGDDNDGNNDDDGVFHYPNYILAGGIMQVTVTASDIGYLNAWVDFNADGDWTDTGEHVIVDQSLSAGVNTLTYSMPAAATGPTFARYRFASVTGLTDINSAPDGEVEDYYLQETPFFTDGFETGDTTGWSEHQP